MYTLYTDWRHMSTQTPDYGFQDKLVDWAKKELKDKGRALIAAAPGAGKTNMGIRIAEDEIKASRGKGTVIVFTHAQTLLRSQWVERLDQEDRPFSYKEILSSKCDLTDNNLVLVLPQTIREVPSDLSCPLLIIDEAHQWYRAKKVQELIKLIKPNKILLLTGSPSTFIRDGDWPINGITLSELIGLGVCTDPVIELIDTFNDRKISDYNKRLEIKSTASPSDEDTVLSMEGMLHQLIEKLISSRREDPSNHKWVRKKSTWKDVITNLKKTMFACRNQEQAVQVNSYLKNAGINSEISISSLVKGSAEMARFKDDVNCSALIVVNRGILGFDFPGLINVIDMTESLNVDRVFQLLCRTVRFNPSSPNQRKLFLKLTGNHTSAATYHVMSFVVALSVPKYYFMCTNYQFDKIPTPKEFNDRLEKIGDARNSGENVRGIDLKDLPKLHTFKDLEMRSEGIASFAYTDLASVKEALSQHISWDEEMVKNLIDSSNCAGRSEFQEKNPNAYAWVIRNERLYLFDKKFPLKGSDWTEASAKGFIGSLEKEPVGSVKGSGRARFRKKNHSLYHWLKERELLYLLDEKYSRRSLDLETVKKTIEGLNCGTRIGFRNTHKAEYTWLLKCKLLQLLDEKFPKAHIPWTVEKAREYINALGGGDRTSFSVEHSGLYTWICNNKLNHLLDEKFPSKHVRWDETKVIKKIKDSKCETRSEFRTGNSGLWEWIKNNKRQDLITDGFPLKKGGKGPLVIWDIGKVTEAIDSSKCFNRALFVRQERSAYNWLRKNKLLRMLDKRYPLKKNKKENKCQSTT